MSHLLPPFRSEREILINEHFLIGPNKKLILRNLQFGFRADWAPEMPPTDTNPKNFLRGVVAVKKARARFTRGE